MIQIAEAIGLNPIGDDRTADAAANDRALAFATRSATVPANL
jgi:hypothetical protein